MGGVAGIDGKTETPSNPQLTDIIVRNLLQLTHPLNSCKAEMKTAIPQIPMKCTDT